MDVTEDLDRGINSEDHWLLLKDSHALVSKGKDVFPTESEVTISILLCRPLSGSEQMRQEQVIEGVLSGLLLTFSLTILSLFKQSWKRSLHCLSSSRVVFKLSTIHSDLVCVSCQWLHRWGAASVSASFFLGCDPWSSFVLAISGADAHLKFALEGGQVLEYVH